MTYAVIVGPDGTPSKKRFCREHLGDLQIDCTITEPDSVKEQQIGDSYEPCVIRAVFLCNELEQYTLIMRGTQTQSILVVPTGYVEARCLDYIAMKAIYPNTPAPELMVNIISGLGGKPLEAVVRAREKETGTYQCFLSIAVHQQMVTFPCRITDAVAIAHFAKIPVNVNTSLLRNSGWDA